ncbi:MAG: hypothetical protein KF866_10465 [Phycisphaeraceae bacterium]|nr:hypothetical protein [Phycisphaeraceae bacterium]MCW5754925.1 hypothetical protein [Phycisphaeraceae bacterium]
MRTMILDHNPQNRKTVASVVAQLGYLDIEEASTVADARAALAEWIPDIVVLNDILPEAVAYAQSVRRRNPKVVILALASDRVRSAAVASVANAVVRPGFTPDVVAQRLTEALANPGRLAEAA